MAIKTTLYQATDGKLFEDEKEASGYQEQLDSSGKNSLAKEAFFKALRSLPEYGRIAEKSHSEFIRTKGNLNAMDIYKDLLLNYPEQWGLIMQRYLGLDAKKAVEPAK